MDIHVPQLTSTGIQSQVQKLYLCNIFVLCQNMFWNQSKSLQSQLAVQSFQSLLLMVNPSTMKDLIEMPPLLNVNTLLCLFWGCISLSFALIWVRSCWSSESSISAGMSSNCVSLSLSDCFLLHSQPSTRCVEPTELIYAHFVYHVDPISCVTLWLLPADCLCSVCGSGSIHRGLPCHSFAGKFKKNKRRLLSSLAPSSLSASSLVALIHPACWRGPQDSLAPASVFHAVFPQRHHEHH